MKQFANKMTVIFLCPINGNVEYFFCSFVNSELLRRVPVDCKEILTLDTQINILTLTL